MQTPHYRSALIVGTGPGLSASLARLFARHGLSVAIAARQTDKLAALAAETGASETSAPKAKVHWVSQENFQLCQALGPAAPHAINAEVRL